VYEKHGLSSGAYNVRGRGETDIGIQACRRF